MPNLEYAPNNQPSKPKCYQLSEMAALPFQWSMLKMSIATSPFLFLQFQIKILHEGNLTQSHILYSIQMWNEYHQHISLETWSHLQPVASWLESLLVQISIIDEQIFPIFKAPAPT